MSDLLYRAIDALSIPLECGMMHQNRFLERIPLYADRKGGTNTAIEYAYTIGHFQAQAALTVPDKIGALDVLDVGCGSGRLAHAMAPLLGTGQYVGVDIAKDDIDRAKRIWSNPRPDAPRISFLHLDHANRTYAPGQAAKFPPYPFADGSFDLATALSVWTHLNHDDAVFYLGEVSRCLRPDGKAIITFFVLDEGYQEFLKTRPAENPYSKRDPKKHTFDLSTDGFDDWRHPSWVKTPEEMIGVTSKGLAELEASSGLKVETIHRGNWRSRPGLFYQDVVTFSKR